MHYHLPQMNSMTVPRVDNKDYALAVDEYGINANMGTLERIGDITACLGERHVKGPSRHVWPHGDSRPGQV